MQVVVRALEADLESAAVLRSAVAEGLGSLDRGEGVDGPAFMRDLIAETAHRVERAASSYGRGLATQIRDEH